MRDVGCTTPFGPNKTNICRLSRDLGFQAKRIFQRIYSHHASDRCIDPCHTILPSIAITDRRNGSFRSAKIKIPHKVKEMTSTFSYSFLSLIAEVGGYVGLFLGVSVSDINSFMEALVSKIISICKGKCLKKNQDNVQMVKILKVQSFDVQKPKLEDNLKKSERLSG